MLEEGGDLEPLGLVGEVPHRAVGLHDLGVAALQHLGDRAGVDAVLGAHPVELEVDREQRVHDLEVDLPRAALERARVAHELAELGERLAGEVVALEVAEPELELPLALVPDGVEVLQEPGHVLPDPSGSVADLPLAT